jgi:aminopyrrolnitrin oxygenase
MLGDREFVAFVSASGTPAVLDGRCVHMGAQLSRGCVVGEHLQCPFHQWEFAQDGRCAKIPAMDVIPALARQRAYPTVERDGHVFFFNDAEPAFECPFFDVAPGALCAARPFVFDLAVPWYLVGANGFDLQHFRAAHDRTLVGTPQVSEQGPFCRTIRATFRVTGNSLRDRLTRLASGEEVTMTIRSWCGALIFVTAEFARTTSYGMVSIMPTGPGHSRVTTTIWVKHRAGAIGRAVLDPVDLHIRRSFIRAFLQGDADRSPGIRYTPGTLIDADHVLREYVDWVLSLSIHSAAVPVR